MENKKIIAINGSKRKKNTYNIINQIKEQIHKENIDIEIINLFDYKIENCLGCELCIRENICPINDDVHVIMKKLIDSDGIILSSPVYVSNISGKLKTFIDRTCKWFHRPELVGKPVLMISTTAGSDLKYVLNYLEKVSIEWGLQPTDKLGRTVNNINNSVQFSEYSSFIKHINMNKSNYKPSLKQLFMFQIQKLLAIKVMKIDYDYWEKNEWHNKVYYYDCTINIINKSVSNMFYKFMYKKVNKVSD